MNRNIVLDTNAFVAAGFKSDSASAQIIEQIRAGRLRMIWNEATRREIERIVRKIPPLKGMQIEDLFDEENRYDEPTHPERFGHVPDPDDRKFAALSDAAGAVLITNDNHLLGTSQHARVPVLSPGQFWDQFSQTTKDTKNTKDEN